ncbi:MAG: protein kinase [Planctomycetales bacterium]|nr:protein kinase [Planctomycetales bacterium]
MVAWIDCLVIAYTYYYEPCTLEADLSALEKEFRTSWRAYDPHRYEPLLARVGSHMRLALLARLLGAEIEYRYQPPEHFTDEQGVSEDEQRTQPCVQLFLLQFKELLENPELLRRLIVLEYALRLNYEKCAPNIESYVSLYPADARQLENLLQITVDKFKDVIASETVSEPIRSNDSTIKETSVPAISMQNLPTNLGPFLLTHMIGRGGMGYVYSAIDLRNAAQVAIKISRRMDGYSIFRFLEEFRWLSQIDHNHVVKLYDAFSEGDHRFFSMELVEGMDIVTWYRENAVPGENWTALRMYLSQIASAIDYLHQLGLVHRDIKATNILISKKRAVLLDLGLVIRANQPSPSINGAWVDEIVGTLDYMAPERILRQPPVPANDWYSFGVVIYEILVGRFPPIKVDLSQTRDTDRYFLDASQLLKDLSDCPKDLATLVLQLLQPDPANRPSGESIIKQLGGSITRPSKLSVDVTCPRRNQILDKLDYLFETFRHDHQAQVICIRGESGIGKSTLVSHWLCRLNTRDLTVLRIRCHQEDHTPLRLLAAILREVIQQLMFKPSMQWQATVNKFGPTIADIFPQIHHLIGATPSANELLKSNPMPGLLSMGLQAVQSLLIELTQLQPMLLAIESAHWADIESCEVLAKLTSSSDQFHGIVVLCDEEEVENNPVNSCFLMGQNPATEDSNRNNLTRIHLDPLPNEVCQELLQQWSESAGLPLNADDSLQLILASGGNPFLLEEVFRSYVRQFQHSEHHGPTSDAQLSVRHRIGRLPRTAEKVLQFLTVADSAVGFHQLQMVSRVLPNQLLHTVSLLSSQGWIRNGGQGFDPSIEIAHERFRKAIIQIMPPAQLQRRHFRWGRILSCETPKNWPRIAFHYQSAGYFREAAASYLQAALELARKGAFQSALAFIALAEHPEAARSPSERLAVSRLKADCLANSGFCVAAAELYDALSKTHGPDQALLTSLAGEQWIRAGKLESGQERLSEGIRHLDISPNNSKNTTKLPQKLTMGLFGLSRKNRQRASKKPDAQLAFNPIEQCLSRVVTPLIFLDNRTGPDLIFTLTRLALDRGSLADRALAFVRYGGLLSFGGPRFRHLAIRWIALGRKNLQVDRNNQIHQSMHFCMYVWYIQRGNLRLALRAANRYLQVLSREPVQSTWDHDFLLWGMAGCHWFRGEFRKLRSETTQLRELAVTRGNDPMLRFLSHVHSSHYIELVEDDLLASKESIRIAATSIRNAAFQSPKFFICLARTFQALYLNDHHAAADYLMSDWNEFEKVFLLRSNHYRWMALCARLNVDLVGAKNNRRRKDYFIADAKFCIRQLRQLKEPTFVTFANAFELAVNAQLGRIAEPSNWLTTIDQLRKAQHFLAAKALQLHLSLYADRSFGQELRKTVIERLQAGGCVHPERLMNLVIALPEY